VTLEQLLRRPETPPLYDRAETDSDSRFTNGRLGTQWRQRVGDVRVELNGNLSAFRSDNGSLRTEFGGAGQPDAVQTWDDRTVARERSANITLKGSLLAGGQERPGSAAPTPEHSLVFGGELEQVSRDETRTSVPDVTDFGDNLSARTQRLAAYVQDEWNPLPTWGANFGLRWEGINTRGDTGQGERPENRTSVWTPLLNMVYRPDPKSRDQVRSRSRAATAARAPAR
jgi:outer membrane receptor for ferrienterochelin and colicins